MAKILEKILKSIKKTMIASTIAVPMLFYGCREENYPPVASLEVNPTKGEVPLEVNIKLTGNDLNGNNDISWYVLNVQNEVIRSKTPIDITRTFGSEGVVNIYGEVIDSKNLNNKTNISSIEIYGLPFIEQSASLINDIELKYSAILSRVDEAILKVNKDGVLLLTENVKDVNQSGADYDKTFNYALNGITKGNYEFDIKSNNLEKKTSVIVPNYNPVSNFGNINIVLNEEADSTITLPVPTDKNPEDNPVPIKSAVSLDGKTQLTLNGYGLNINALPGKTGNYQIEIEYGNSVGGLEKTVIQGNITKDTRIKVDPFVSTNTNGVAYDLLTTKVQRDNLVQTELNEDWVSEFAPSNNPLWDCTEYAKQLTIDFHGFGGIEGYFGDNRDSILYYHGTWKDNGKYGLPIYSIEVGTEHEMNAIATGNDITKFSNWNFIEPQFDQMNVQPGQAYMPNNCEIVINYNYVKENEVQGKFLSYIPIIKFQITNGIPVLKWINNDPNVNLIKQRSK
jgi:hypothetical protein